MLIESEEPKDHWGFLNVKGKTVLDLGCGWYSVVVSQSTPAYFLSRGAFRVIGYDNHSPSCERLHDLNNFELYIESVCHADEIRQILKKYKPNIIKCDIEGSEQAFKEISSEEMSLIEEIAIEYHNGPLKDLIKNKMIEWQFKIIDEYPLGPELTKEPSTGVFHGRR